jgi:hypothetical protein
LVLAAGVAAAFLIRGQLNDERLERARADGMQLYEAGDYAGAARSLGMYVARVKTDYEATIAYAESQEQVPQPNGAHIRQAIGAARLATEIDPDRPEGFEILLRLFSVAGFRTEVVETAERLIALSSGGHEPYLMRVAALTQLGRMPEAHGAAEAFIEAFPERLDAHLAYAELQGVKASDTIAALDYLRSDPAATILTGRVPYHLAVSRQSAVGVAGAKTEEERAELGELAISQARLAAGLEPADQSEALAMLEWLRRLAVPSRDASLAELADDLLISYLDRALFDDRFAASESMRAWWRLEDDRAVELAMRIDPRGGVSWAIGWRLVLASQAGSPVDCVGCRESLEAAGDTDAASWLAIASAADPSAAALAPTGVLSALESVTDAELRPLADLLRGEVLLRNGQNATALVAYRSAAEDAESVLERARAALALADLLAEQGDLGAAEALLLRLQRAGVQGEIADVVATRFVERRLAGGDVDLGQATAESFLASAATGAVSEPADAGRAAFYARILLVSGRIDEGLREARRAAALDPAGAEQPFIALAEIVERHDDDLSRRLLEAAASGEADRVRVVAARALSAARRGMPDEGLALLDAFEAASNLEQRQVAIVRAEYMDATGLPNAAEAFARLSADHPDSAIAQTAVLTSSAAWTDSSVIRSAITRLRRVTGDDAIEWRLASAKADLRFIDQVSAPQRQAHLARVVTDLLALLRRDPGNSETELLIAEAYRELGDSVQAIRFLSEAVGPGPRASAYPALIGMLAREGRLDEAGQNLEAFARVSAVSPDLRRQRAVLFERFGRLGEAQPDRAWLADRGELADRVAYGLLQARLGDVDGARRIAEAISTDDPASDGAMQGAFRIFVALGDFDRAITLAERSAASDVERDRRLGRLFVDHSQYLRAVERLARLPLPARRAGDAILLAHANLELARVAAATEAVRDIEEEADTGTVVGFTTLRNALLTGADSPPRYLAVRLLAAGLAARSEVAEALAVPAGEFLAGNASEREFADQLDRLTVERPGDGTIWRARLQLAAALEADEPVLIEILERAADAAWTELWPLQELAERCIAARDLDAAEEAARRLASRAGADPFVADVLRARIEVIRGDAAAAANWLTPHQTRLFAADGPSPQAAFLVRVFAAAGRADDLERLVDGARVRDPSWSWLYLDAAEGIAATEPQTARRWLERVDDEFGPSERPIARGMAWFALSNWTFDADDARRALTFLGTNDDTAFLEENQLLLATLEERSGDPSAAMARLGRVLLDDPDDVFALNNAAYLAATKLEQSEEALPQIRRAISLAEQRSFPSSVRASLYHTLAVVQRKAGMPEAAEEALRKGIDLGGETLTLAVELAELLIASERAEEARQILDALPDGPGGSGPLYERLRAARAELP